METYIGFHCVTHPDGIGMLIQSGAQLVLSVDNVGVLEEAERLRPGINKIMRFYVPNITAEEGRHRDPIEFARWYVNDSPMADKIRVNLAALRMPNLWLQGWNEPVFKKPGPVPGIDVDDEEGFDWLAAAEAERIRLLAGMGIRAASFSLSTGYPTVSQFRRLSAAFPAMRLNGACILIHGYSAVPMAENTDDTNREEKYFNEVTKPMGYGDIPFAFGEWGREWQAQGVSDTDYRDQIAAGDTRIRNFVKATGCKVLGFALYTLGDDSNRTWGRYKLDGRMPEFLSDYLKWIRQQPDTEPVPAPHPPPVTPPSTRFNIGDTYEVVANPAVRVRTAPAGGFVRWAGMGERGTIMGGPQVVKLGTQMLNWWRVLDGWIAESQSGVDYLVKVAPPAPRVNILRNHSFAGGTRPVSPPFISGAWPKEYDVEWFYTPADPVIGTGTTWTLAEMITIQFGVQFPEPEHKFGADDFILNCFWAYGALGFGWKQTIDVPAGRYRLRVPVKPDHWHRIPKSQWEAIRAVDPTAANHVDADPNFWQVRPSPHTSLDWFLASEVYADLMPTGAAPTNNWLDANTVPIGRYTVLEAVRDHPGGPLTARFGARGRWPFIRNGWMFDELELVRLD